jgi:hypothetical protein
MSPRGFRLLAIAAAALALAGGRAWALGKPDWARPYLSMPSPSGAYIAKNDHWAVVYEEVEFDLTADGRIVERHRSILENLSSKEAAFHVTLEYDDGQFFLSDMALNMEKTLWHEIDLQQKAVTASEAGGVAALVTGTEPIQPRRRVVWEYTRTDRYDLLPWSAEFLPESYPVAAKKLYVSPAAAARGLTLTMVGFAAGAAPPGFAKGADGSWTVSSIPARSRLLGDLAFQPDLRDLYPWALVTFAGDRGSWEGFASRMAKAWSDQAASMDAAQLKAKADALCAGAKGPWECASRLARFVQNDVQYDDSNEKGINAWLPLEPQETLRSMKADCKGKVLLLLGLLKAEGIESAPVLLRVSDRFFTWGERAGAADINHVIIAVKLPPGEKPAPGTLLEGPLKEWILFDPTRSCVVLGGSLPGYEGLPALALGGAAPGRFVLSTHSASAEVTRAKIKARLLSGDVLDCDAVVQNNGSSPLVLSLMYKHDDEKSKDRLQQTIGAFGQRVDLLKHALVRPADDPAGTASLSFSFMATRAVQELSSSFLLNSPLALGARVQGIPDGLPRRPPASPDDEIKLEPPWDARRNCGATLAVLDVDMDLELPPGMDLEPPAERIVDKPWLQYRATWTRTGPQRWHAAVRLEERRGDWPASERKEHLQVTDEIFRGLYAPLLLKRSV